MRLQIKSLYIDKMNKMQQLIDNFVDGKKLAYAFKLRG